MRGHLFGRGWRLATPQTVNRRFNHADRWPGHHVQETNHLVRNFR
jgi:hypothetical protein